MKPLNEHQTNNHQKEGSKREDKKKTNIKFNSAIFFQIGLVVALVASAWAMNLKVGEGVNPTPYKDKITFDEPTFYDFDVFVPKVEPVKTEIAVVTKPVQRVITDVVEVIKNDTPITAPTIVTAVTAPVAPAVKPPVVDPPIKNTGPTSINTVEFVPIFPGCESAGDNAARKACMSDKIGRFISRKFDTSVADESSYGNQRIIVQFKIDKQGRAVDIIARAPDKNLQKEAQRVIGKLPTLIPGRMGDEPVDVLYMLPINFQINN